MKGLFSEEALLRYAELVAQSKSLDFSEDEFYDFTRCVRPNGSAYGTGGRCRKGTEEDKEIETAQERRLEGQKTAKLSDTDKKALFDYTEDKQGSRSFFDLNRCLRVPSICRDKEGSAKFVKELDSAIKKLPKNESGEPFYRGLNFRPGAFTDQEKLWSSLQNVKPGDVLKDPGFGSYTANRRVAENFMNKGSGQRNIIFISRNKALTPINHFANIKDEEEALLPRRTPQTIRSVTKTGDYETGYTLTIELD